MKDVYLELEALLRCEVVPIDSKLSPEERVRRRFGRSWKDGR